jgi:voltage-gated potassium channel
VLGFPLLDALYQTVTTVFTVGFREVRPFDSTTKVFTMLLIVSGVGAVLYGFSALVETLVEGHLGRMFERRRMDKRIERMTRHVIVCGWGRVGRALVENVQRLGQDVVVVDQDEGRLADCPVPWISGDATDESVLHRAGAGAASALVAAIDTDPENLYVTLTARALWPDLFIIARARTLASEPKLLQAGADRVVNPQAIGGQRMAAFVVQPHVTDFLDVVMHDAGMEFRLQEVLVEEGSPMAGTSVADARIREMTGAMVLAMRTEAGEFITNPSPSTPIQSGHVLISVGTPDQLSALADAVSPGGRAAPGRSGRTAAGS